MYLKKLELQGFKSFANKTVFDFSSGITAIVGPNGSGKSNVIDALRWILGESSAKNMRADKSENLIFSGTSKKARSSMAEVSVTFDNSSQFFPVDFSEVVIRRRVTRDGVSKYWINESAVRLRDIVDLFAQARLGTQFSIVSQGSADSFIAASPSQRREMMEEILGLRRYQIKRRDAKNKLALTQTNLERVRALIEELLPHLRLLRRQAKKWERAGEVEKELLEVEKRYFGARIKALSVMDARIVPLEQELKEKHERCRTDVKSAQDAFVLVEKRAPKKEEKGELRARYEKLFTERGELERRLSSLEAEIRILSSTKSVPLNHQLLLSVASSLKEVLQNISQFNFDFS
ncbi:MAG: AAA family ATPase [Candidatus Paceibacterota bacterium]